MHIVPKGDTPAQPDQVPSHCPSCEQLRADGSTCADCGAALRLAPAADELLEQLVAGDGARCLYCPDPILAGDMFVGRALLGVLAHFACYAQEQNLARPVATEAQS